MVHALSNWAILVLTLLLLTTLVLYLRVRYMMWRKGIRKTPAAHLEDERVLVPAWLTTLYSLLLALFALLHGVLHFGLGSTLFSFVSVVFLSWGIEHLGITAVAARPRSRSWMQ